MPAIRDTLLKDACGIVALSSKFVDSTYQELLLVEGRFFPTSLEKLNPLANWHPVTKRTSCFNLLRGVSRARGFGTCFTWYLLFGTF